MPSTTTTDGAAQEILRAWIHRVLDQTSWTPHRLAREARVGVATISRALDANSTSTISTRTIEKIVRATGIAAPTGIGMGANSAKATGFAEPEAIYVPEMSDELSPLRPAEHQAVWQIGTRGIELAGYHMGDYVLVDPETSPLVRDVVCVQLYDLQRGTAETVFRVYEPPYVVTETADPTARRKPVAIDNERAAIWGVVVKSLRLRTPPGTHQPTRGG